MIIIYSIYKITNLVNNKIYIGKTRYEISKRFKEHFQDSKRRRCEKRPLYDAINKYGEENFIIEEIENNLTDEKACEREKYWIKEYNSYVGFENSNGYNATLGGDSKQYYDYEEIAKKYLEVKTVKDVCNFFHCDPETVRVACNNYNVKIIPQSEKNKRKVLQIDTEGNIVKIFESASDAAESIGKKRNNGGFKNRVRGVNGNHFTSGYFWYYEDNYVAPLV